MTTEYVQRRTAGEGAITKPSERMIKARASLPAEADSKLQTPDPSSAEARNMVIYRALTKPMGCSELAEATGVSYDVVYASLGELVGDGRIMKGADKKYTRVAGMGWSEKELQAVTYIPGRGRTAKPRTDVLAPMVGEKRIPSKALPTYRQAFEDISHLPHYGVGEIDSAIKALKDTLRARLDNVEYECPLCSRAVEVTARTSCRCKRCGWTIDVGSVERALELAKHYKSE